MSGTDVGPRRRLELVRVGELTFDVVRRDFAVGYGLVLLLGAAPGLAAAVNAQTVLSALKAASPGVLPGVFGPLSLLSLVLNVVASLLTYAALSWSAVESLEGRTPSLGQRLAAALRCLPAMIGIGVLAEIAFVFAALLLVFPAVMLAMAWSVVAPVAAVERAGVFRAFGRSGELTRGCRWTIFFFLLIVMVGGAAMSALSGSISSAVFGGSGLLFLSGAVGPAFYLVTALRILLGGLVTLVSATGAGVLYHELRALKGGLDPRTLSDVFA